MALYDLFGAPGEVPLWQIFGGLIDRDAGPFDRRATTRRLNPAGGRRPRRWFRHIKVKVGANDPLIDGETRGRNP